MFSDQSTPAQNTDSRISIELRGLGKTYRLYATPRDRLKQMIWNRLRPGRQDSVEAEGVDERHQDEFDDESGTGDVARV